MSPAGKLTRLSPFETESKPQQYIHIDEDLARQYVCALKKLQRELGLTGNVDINLLANVRELHIIFAPSSIPTEVVTEIMDRVLPYALEEFDLMRQREGRALARDILRHIRQIRRDVTAVERRTPRIVQHHANRLHAKVKQLTKDYAVDDARVSQEIALFATRCDISEELARVVSHLDQCQTLMKAGTAVGKTLNFLMQELNREVNTMGTKGNDLDVSHRTVAIKGETGGRFESNSKTLSNVSVITQHINIMETIEDDIPLHRRRGLLFVISGPSGAGKTSLCNQLIASIPRLRFSISYTTRPQPLR